MESQRALFAIILSVLILLGYQYFFVPTPPPNVAPVAPQISAGPSGEPAAEVVLQAPQAVNVTGAGTVLSPTISDQSLAVAPQGRDVTVETDLYRAVFTEAGGGLKSFRLKSYRETLEENSAQKELVFEEGLSALPLFFSWGVEPARSPITLFAADRTDLSITDGAGSVTMASSLSTGVEIRRSLTFRDHDYAIEMEVEVINRTAQPLQGAPYLRLSSRPFSPGDMSSFMFTGPAVMKDGVLEEIKVEDLVEKGGQTVAGKIGWVAYEDTYFMASVLPRTINGAPYDQVSVQLSASDGDRVSALVTSQAEILQPGGASTYHYTLYYGPKELKTLAAVGGDLDRIVNFGWWDFIAKPTLHLLKFLYGYVHNYGIAIILVTVIFKMLFWPIAQKGMKSMKTMQKLQPKMAKLREKYANDKDRLNQEMMQLYRTYKVNPVGGCLPMVLQIPVFFALYKVLLQTIELRHAPFMLWMNDLSAPDRLAIGFDIPYLGGIPVLTLLMGASMFLQQRMTPSTGDPTQAKIMMFMPVIFTFMFLNFASGLVLYWFVNNLLSILQQYLINRQVEE